MLISQLKDRVSRNEYRVDADAVAEAIVRRLERRARGSRTSSEGVLESRHGASVAPSQRHA
jgi:hypothetical protein